MTPEQIKAICHELGDTFSHKKMAELAGVPASTWSDYCNYEKPDVTISLGRMFCLQRKLGRRDFTQAIIEHDRAGAAEAADPRRPAAQVAQAIGDALVQLTLMLEDDAITGAEKREALEKIAHLSSRVAALNDSVSALPTGRVALRAV